jgi:hypothetical protein
LSFFLIAAGAFRNSHKLIFHVGLPYSVGVTQANLWLRPLAIIFFFSSGLAQDKEKPMAFDWQQAKGTVMEHLACVGDPTQSYALYIPSRYSPDRAWPVIYAFDPFGRGPAAVEVYRAAAEKYGYIVAASNNSRNGPASLQTTAAQAMWLDTHRRFSIDKGRVYTTGLSGGARAATAFALYCYTCAVAGVIAHGAGYPVSAAKSPPANDHFLYYAVVGDQDLNYPEIMVLRRKKDDQGAPFKVKVYPAPHQWAPPEIAEDAVEWLEIKAMQSGAEKVNPAFVREIFTRTQAEAAQAEQAGDTLREYYALRSLALDFKGMEDVTQFESKRIALKTSKAWRNATRTEDREIELQASLTKDAGSELAQLASAEAEVQPGLIQHIASLMASLRRQAHSNDKDRMVASRAFTQLWIQGLESGQDQFREGHYTQAAAYYNLMADAAPDQPAPLVYLAEARVRTGNKKGALKAIEEAVQRGLKRPQSLTDDPELQPLASDPAFQEIVQGLRAKQAASGP